MARIISLLAVVLTLTISGIQAQQADSIVFREYQQEITVFEDLRFGRSMTNLFFIPETGQSIAITALMSDGGKERVNKDADSDRHTISYLEEPTLVINYRQTLYQLDVEMIRIPYPEGGEINWQIVPRIKISLR